MAPRKNPPTTSAADMDAALDVLGFSEPEPAAPLGSKARAKLDQINAKSGPAKKAAGSVLESLKAMKGASLPVLRRLVIGVGPLDLAWGGGLVLGRVHTFVGLPSAGKSWLCFRTLAAAQQTCAVCLERLHRCTCGAARPMRVLYIPLEEAYDPEWGAQNGIDNEALYILPPSTGEDLWAQTHDLVASGEIDMVALDSLAVLSSRKELAGEISEGTPAVQARMIGQGLRRLLSRMLIMQSESALDPTKSCPTLIMTNQIRADVGTYGSPETSPGGNLPKFAAATETRVKGYMKQEGSDGARVNSVTFVVRKNKTFRPMIQGTYAINLAPTERKQVGEPIDEPELISLARALDVLTREGNQWRIGEEIFRVLDDVKAKLEIDPAFKAAVVSALIAAQRSGKVAVTTSSTLPAAESFNV